MQCFNNDLSTNLYDYSHFGSEVSSMTASEYKARIFFDYHYKDFSNEGEGLNCNAAYNNLLLDALIPQIDLPAPTKTHRNIWVKKVKLPAQPVHCDVCDCTLNSSAQAEAHFKGQSHQRRLMKKAGAVDPSHQIFKHDADMRMRFTEGYSSFEGSETLDFTDKSTAVEVDEKREQQAIPSAVGVSLPDTGHQRDHDELRVTEPPKKKQRVILAIPCEVCGLTFNSEAQANDHFKSIKHVRRTHLLQRIIVEDTLPVQESLNGPSPPGKCRFHCGICNVYSNSGAQFDQHCSGQGHKKKLLNFSAPENETTGNKSGWFYCRTCDISCRTALGLQKHVSSEDHKTNIQAKTDQTKTDSEHS